MPEPIQKQILHRAQATGEQLYLCQPVARQWQQWTWSQAVDEALRMAASLQRLGLKPGDRVAIISKNCAHWVIADMALILSGLVSVPIFPTANARTIAQVLEHSDAGACFVGKLEHPDQQLPGIDDSILSIAMPYPKAAGKFQWADLVAEPADDFKPHPVAETDLATLLYTSGSTGEPKGAMHSFGNFAFVGDSLARAIGFRDGDRVLSYLPLSHCTERAYVEAGSFYGPSTLYFVETLDTFMADLAHARPTLFGSVPRLWKKFQLGVLENVPQKKLDLLLRVPLLCTLIQRKIKRGLGLDQADWFASGSAPIAPALLKWWARLGVHICEGWGMTETFAYGTQIGRRQRPRIGTISTALPGVQLKTVADAELLIRCPCMMQGYYKDQELTERSFEDGYFKTGDRAFIDDQGWISITGRVKEIFKTTKGKYIAPVPLESLLARNELIEQACVVGEHLAQPVALVQLAEHIDLDMRELRRQLVETLDAVNAELESHQRISQIIIIKERWTVDNELLTPTLKIRREAIEQRYRPAIEQAADRVAFYSGPKND
ncbi:MAG: AMP-binding protein [Wenzhouxiangellaceae bacterium]|nr:AMP-binding protein [Wenzhouxiangellaceae bacterium]